MSDTIIPLLERLRKVYHTGPTPEIRQVAADAAVEIARLRGMLDQLRNAISRPKAPDA